MKRPRSWTIRAALPCLMAATLTFAGCARQHTTAPPAAPAVASTPATYPPVSPAAVEILNRFPTGLYDKLGTITVQENASIPLGHTVAAIRDNAAHAGANAIVLVQQRQFTQHNEFTRQRTPTRRTVFVLLRRGTGPLSRGAAPVSLNPSGNPGPPPGRGSPPAVPSGRGAR